MGKSNRAKYGGQHQHKGSANFVQHVPHNSTTEQYRFYDDVVNGNGNHIFQHQHVQPMAAASHKQHNNSLASMGTSYRNFNYHNRGNTASKYMLDDTLDVIDGDIPSQKDIMKDFFQERVNHHLQQQSNIDEHPHFVSMDLMQPTNNNEDTKNAHIKNDSFLYSQGGTMRQIIGSPIDENDVIEFNGMDMEEIEIPDYTDSDDEDQQHDIDPMKLIAAKQKLRKKQNKNNKDHTSFPDTEQIQKKMKKKREKRRHNTQRSPLPNMKYGDITPASVIIKGSDSDNDTYNSSDDSEPRPSLSHRGSEKIEQQNDAKNASRANTMTNIKSMINNKNNMILNNNNNDVNPKHFEHRHSRSEVPKSTIKKNDLFHIYNRSNVGESAKALFSNLTKTAKLNQKSNQFEVERKAKMEAEKIYKPQLEKTKLELDEERKKSFAQEQKIKAMELEIEELKKRQQHEHSLNIAINKKLREKNLEIKELQSKLKFEKQRSSFGSSSGQISNHSLYIPPGIPSQIITAQNNGTIPPHPSMIFSKSTPVNDEIVGGDIRRRSKRFSIDRKKTKDETKQLFEGLHRLKQRASISHKNNNGTKLKARTTRNHSVSHPKKPLWSKNVRKSENFGDMFTNRMIKKRHSLLLQPNSTKLKSRFFDKNKTKRGSLNTDIYKKDNEVIDAY